ncbi:calpain-5-like isoform X1 [Astyanax mexicanus]|uniref:Calpain-5-like isoform X1 n=2 Tax=Astyanax mexicanus TaxID=7994 RepID=A0A8T2LRL2_ASTMX|nr:calpain-5-like isoform X1 [Astyanax mexicanus]
MPKQSQETKIHRTYFLLQACHSERLQIPEFQQVINANQVHLLVSGTFLLSFTGSMWIYSIYPPNYNSTLPGEPYCNKTLYQFAFWTTTVGYIVIAVLLVLGCSSFLWCYWRLLATLR